MIRRAKTGRPAFARVVGGAVLLLFVTTIAAPATPKGPGIATSGRTPGSPEPSASPGAAPPNVLILLTDDQTFVNFTRALMPATFAGLVDQGVTFTRAYNETPLCCPSRSELMTGLYAHHTGVDENDVVLGASRPTAAQALQDAGYATMLAGKYLNSETCDPHPGWDRWVCANNYSELTPEFNVDGTLIHPNGIQPDLLAGYVNDFIAATPPSQPFFVEFTPTVPHVPADDPRNDSLVVPGYRPPSYDEDTTAGGKPAYMRRPALTPYEKGLIDTNHMKMTRVLTPLDADIGSILGGLGSRAQDTMVIFLSDNGFEYGDHRRTDKRVPYQESIHTPLVIRYPALIPPGQPFTSGALVQNVDLTPTIMDLAGIPWSADGHSLVPILAQQASSVRSAALVEGCQATTNPCTPNGDYPFLVPSYFGVVTKKYAYVEYGTGERELYDLRNDPYELQNHAGDPAWAARESKLASQLQDLLAEPQAPPVTVVAGPSGPSAVRRPSFLFFTPQRGSTLSCRMLGAPGHAGYRACTSGVSYGPLADGSYEFDVLATDPGGHRSAVPASRSFTISTTGPAASIISGPADPTNQTSATLRFETPAGGVTLECRLDRPGSAPGSFQSCPSGTRSYSGLSDGAYVFEARANDGAGGVTDPPAFWAFTVDTAGPMVSFDVAPPAISNDTTASFVFDLSVPPVGDVRCRLDAGASRSCLNGSLTYGAVRAGSHTLTVTATDGFGVQAITSYPFTVDLTAPTIVTFTDLPDRFSPNGDGHDDTTKMTIASSEQSTMDYSISTIGGMQVIRIVRVTFATSFANVWNGYDDKGVLTPPGTYRYAVTVTDQAGNATTRSGFVTLIAS